VPVDSPAVQVTLQFTSPLRACRVTASWLPVHWLPGCIMITSYWPVWYIRVATISAILEEDRHQYIFNTTDDFATRQTKRSWASSYHADDWVFAWEELHADQVDWDQILPILLWDAGYPVFVSLIFCFSSSIQQEYQAISPQEILSLHKYLAACYDFNDYEAYISNSVEKCRQRLVNLSEEQHPT